MAQTSSAKKAYRSSLKRRVFNVRRAKTMKAAIKDISKLIETKDAKGAAAMMSTLQKALDKAAKNGTIKKNAAARTKSRISKRIKAIAA